MSTEIINLVNTILAFSSALISIMALVFTVKTFWLKKGAKVTGYVNFSSSVDTENKFPYEIILENSKDKAIIVYKIYLRFDYSYYLLLEDFENEPLIIQPFSVYKHIFDPVISYSVNLKRIDIDELIDNKKVKKVIYLSTSEGKIKVTPKKRYWNPIMLFFKNNLTCLINPNRIYYKGKAYGSNIKYIVELNYNNNKLDVLSFNADDYKYIKYKNIFSGDIIFSESDFKTAESLKAYFLRMKSDKKIPFNNIDIIDFQEYIKINDTIKSNEVIRAKKINAFMYFIVGKIVTRKESRRIKKLNQMNNSKAKK